jgi:UDP:flavonoid glycosyltransferase YjiC (YdhE family)
MRITLSVIGSRGDVQPMVALGKGLKAAGHEVRLFTHDMFEDLVRDHDIELVPLEGDPRQALLTQAIVEIGNNPIRISRWIEENFRPVLPDIFRLTLEAAGGSDLIVNSALSMAGWHVAEHLRIPSMGAYLQPISPTRAFHSMAAPPPPSWLPFKKAYNYWSTKLSNQFFFRLTRESVNECRERVLGLHPLSSRYYWKVDTPTYMSPFIYGYSPSVLPRPADWAKQWQITGYWFLEGATDYEPPQGLRDFLESGPVPIYIGFGSMIDHERDEMTRLIVEALDKAGKRAVLHTGWTELGSSELPDSILCVDDVPHDWLFPRVSAVVHHGGAGTTAAGLRAGVPTVIVAFFGDQFFWGWRVHELGVGPKWIPRKRLTAEGLANAIERAIEDEQIRRRVAAVGRQIRSEDGVGAAVQMIERFVQDR